MSKTIFVVDDSDANLSVAEAALEEHYDVFTMPSAIKMLSLLEKIIPDLILLDIEMPEIDGFDALCHLKGIGRYSKIPVIFLTGWIDAEAEVRGFELGAVDFITKPFSVPVLLNRIKSHLDVDELIHERTEKLQRMQNSIVFVLADMVENRDKTTGGHIERTTEYISILISAMREWGVYADELSKWDIEVAVSSARLHDVGKIAISDLILNKPDRLTEDEFETMKSHAAQGERIINQIIDRSGEEEFLLYAKLFAGYHHERWDGSGYPYGLNGVNIPLQGRIMAIADVYDALVFERPYKRAFSDEEAAAIILADSGKHFDPKIANMFYTVKDSFKAVRANLCI